MSYARLNREGDCEGQSRGQTETSRKWNPLDLVTAQLGLKEWAESRTVLPRSAAQVCRIGVQLRCNTQVCHSGVLSSCVACVPQEHCCIEHIWTLADLSCWEVPLWPLRCGLQDANQQIRYLG